MEYEPALAEIKKLLFTGVTGDMVVMRNEKSFSGRNEHWPTSGWNYMFEICFLKIAVIKKKVWGETDETRLGKMLIVDAKRWVHEGWWYNSLYFGVCLKISIIECLKKTTHESI